MRVTRSARRHRQGVAHIRAAILNAGEAVYDETEGAYSWVGIDDRGIELEVVAVPDDKRDGLAIIHAMPTEFRKRKK